MIDEERSARGRQDLITLCNATSKIKKNSWKTTPKLIEALSSALKPPE